MARKVVAPQRREQIVEALFNCLADNGYEKVTVKDIAKRANLHYGVIHYYFKSKDDIVTAVSDYIITRSDKLLQERVHPNLSARDKLSVAIDYLVDESIFNRPMNRVFYNLVQMAFEQKSVSAALRRLLRVYRNKLAEVIEEGVENGEFAPCDPNEIASLMLASVEGMALQWVIEPRAVKRNSVKGLIQKTMEAHLGIS